MKCHKIFYEFGKTIFGYALSDVLHQIQLIYSKQKSNSFSLKKFFDFFFFLSSLKFKYLKSNVMYCYKARSYWLGSYHITQVSTSIFLACTAITVLFNWPEISFKLFLIQFQLSFTNQCHAKSLFEFSIKN